VFGQSPIFLIETDASFRAIEFLFFAIEGIACGILAVLMMKSLQYSTSLSQRLPIPFAMKPMLAGFALSLVALQVPEVLGAGQEVFREVIVGNGYSAETLLLILVTKLLGTVVCIGFGFAGGVIFPSMLIGVLFGALFALIVPEQLLDSYSGVFDYAICGLAAMMSPVIGAPMTALLLVFELTRNYEIAIAAMVTIVFSNLVASNWYGRSLYDQLLALRGIDLSKGREYAYLTHHKVSEHLAAALPVAQQDASPDELRQQLSARQTASIVIVDDEQRYLGILQHQQLLDLGEDSSIATIEFREQPIFDEQTSIREAMQIMRDYMGEAIAVVDSRSGRYLGSIPQSVVINAYLDATAELRREEHEL
jgi:chloride channel protein, CIC family